MAERKGQFFIIGAVIILLALFSLNSDLGTEWKEDVSEGTEWKEDVSEGQGSDSIAVLSDIRNGINATVLASAPDDLSGNLKKFSLAEKDSLKNRYSLDIIYNVSASSVAANVTLKSKDVYIEKMIVVPRV